MGLSPQHRAALRDGIQNASAANKAITLLDKVDDTTASAAELSTLNGITALVSDLNVTEGMLANAVVRSIGGEVGNSIRVKILLVNGAEPGNSPVAYGHATVLLSDDEDGIGETAATPDGGLSAGTNGKILGALVTDSVLLIQANDEGRFDLDISETGADTWYAVVLLPNGKQVVSNAIVFS